MSEAAAISTRRYRRRILALGVVVFGVVFAIGAAVFVPVVQDDLVERVESALADTGVDGVSASFSGQDGTLRCANGLADPEEASDVAGAVDGVRVVTLDASCEADPDEGGGDADPDSASDDATNDGSDGAEPVEPDTTTTTEDPSEATTTSVDVAEAVLDVIDEDPLFGQLSTLVATAGLDGGDALGGAGPFTVLAPTDVAFDAAFEEFGADALRALADDPERLRTLLLHHVVGERIGSGDFDNGPLQMLDGSTVDVTAGDDGVTFSSAGTVAAVAEPDTQLDIDASNGIVHAVDRLLLPDGFTFASSPAVATTAARLDGGVVTLTGTVANDGQRATLVAAAAAAVPAEEVVDALVVETDAAVADPDVERLAAAVSSLGVLVSGDATLVGDDLSLVGVARDEASVAAARATSQAAVDPTVTVDITITESPDVSAAEALQAALNEFVTANPIRFEPNSAELSAEANAVLSDIAALAQPVPNVRIEIVGHTDTDGDADSNLQLSQIRAAAVADGLVALGLDPASVSSSGRGGEEPILVDGAEDLAASRRVEFVVEAIEP